MLRSRRWASSRDRCGDSQRIPSSSRSFLPGCGGFHRTAAEDLDDKIIELIETEIKYEGYISKAMDQVAKMKRMEEKRIPANIDWDDIDSIATEARQKFKLINPETIGQASRISGVNPADISILMVYLEGKNRSISKTLQKSK